MAFRHVAVGSITFLLGCIPVHFVPVLAKQGAESVALRQRYLYAEAAFSARFLGFYKIVLMTKVHEPDPGTKR